MVNQVEYEPKTEGASQTLAALGNYTALEGPNTSNELNGTFAPRYVIYYNDDKENNILGFLQNFEIDISMNIDIIDAIDAENICYQYGSRRYSWSGTFIAGKMAGAGSNNGSSENMMVLAANLGMFDIALEAYEPKRSRYAYGKTFLRGCTIEKFTIGNFSADNTAPTVNMSGLALEFGYTIGTDSYITDHTYKANEFHSGSSGGNVSNL